jgi:hypothetical protein
MAGERHDFRWIYHKDDGPKWLPTLDALHALRFPAEWSATPWPGQTAQDPTGASALLVDDAQKGPAA